jgi:hypothetical protein
VESAAKKLFDDLLSVEVNTILKPGMTGRKMPNPAHALLDIHAEYTGWMSENTGYVDRTWREFVSTDGETFATEVAESGEYTDWGVFEGERLIVVLSPLPAREHISWESFDDLRTQARLADNMHRLLSMRHETYDGGAVDVMLRRITRNCDQLKALLQRAAPECELTRANVTGTTDEKPLELAGEDVITIRKAWEMGTETVVMQTVVQLDGDIVTRLNDAYTGAAHEPVRELHSESVGTALGHWKYLVDTFVKITTNAMEYLKG